MFTLGREAVGSLFMQGPSRPLVDPVRCRSLPVALLEVLVRPEDLSLYQAVRLHRRNLVECVLSRRELIPLDGWR